MYSVQEEKQEPEESRTQWNFVILTVNRQWLLQSDPEDAVWESA